MITRIESTHGNAITMDEGVAVAFIDSDWLDGADGAVPALVVDTEGVLWAGDRRISTGGEDAAGRAAELLSSYADDVAVLLDGIDSTRVTVTGQGIVASEVRRRVGARAEEGRERPLAIAEMTGNAAEVINATRSVADGGLVILAGQSRGAFELNVYSDLHRRGLRLVGIPGLREDRDRERRARELADGGEVRNRDALPAPVEVRAGEPLTPAQWHRVVR